MTTIHVTRHGQPHLTALTGTINPEFPPGDPPLSALGQKQAAWLGVFLKKIRFQGTIFSSPYRRTLETAQIIAAQLKLTFFPEKTLQEYVLRTGYPEFPGLNLKQMKTRYPNFAPNSAIVYPWFVAGPETGEDVQARVQPFLESLKKTAGQEFLLVGHGASVHACQALLIPEKLRTSFDPGPNWNCSLSSYAINADGSTSVVRLFDVTHLPKKYITSNLKSFKEFSEQK